MAALAEVSAWLRQARADLRAGRTATKGALDCHRRYWLQQACEKGLKAMGLLLWDEKKNSPQATNAFKTHFATNHSPLKTFGAYAAKVPDLSLIAFDRELRTELKAIDRKGVLTKVDGTTPSHKPGIPSYRYPFEDAGIHCAPCDWNAKRWNAYQGSKRSVVVAVEKLLERVEDLVRRRANAP